MTTPPQEHRYLIRLGHKRNRDGSGGEVEIIFRGCDCRPDADGMQETTLQSAVEFLVDLRNLRIHSIVQLAQAGPNRRPSRV